MMGSKVTGTSMIKMTYRVGLLDINLKNSKIDLMQMIGLLIRLP